MTSKRQFNLLPESGSQMLSALDELEAVTSGLANSDFEMPHAVSFASCSRYFFDTLKSHLSFIAKPRNKCKRVNVFTLHSVDGYLYDPHWSYI